MRDIALVGALLVGLAMTTAYPFAGVILWTWISIQSPHQEAYSFSRSMPLNLIVATVTVLAWLLSRERKLPPNQFLTWSILIFLAWTTFNSFFAVAPDWSWPFWDRTWKTFALGLLIATLATNQVRIQAIIWTIVLSLFYFGVKGGLFTLINGGHDLVLGPEGTIIGDNNQLAVALLMTLPLANYLRRQSINPLVRALLATGMVLTLIAIFGTYSRGAMLGMAALAIVGLFRTHRPVLYLAAAGIIAYGLYHFMPDSFWDRMDTLKSLNTDASFHGRQVAWQVAYMFARDHFPWGAGFYGPQLDSVFHHYFPKEEAHAAHSIFFQVLGENGFGGLAIYLSMILGAFWKSFAIVRRCRGKPELEWASDLSKMIQMTLFVFCVAGAALSMAYYDVFIICALLLVSLDICCRSKEPAFFAERRPPIMAARQIPLTWQPHSYQPDSGHPRS
jgi:putative inorganic carbon (HCO3(-)) transporter